MEEKQTIMALGAGATTKFVFKPEEEKRELSDTGCQTAKERDTGGDFCFAKQTFMQKSSIVAVSSDTRLERVENVKDVKNYLERVDEMIRRKIKKMGEIRWH